MAMNITIKTMQGIFQGMRECSLSGREIFAFRGIPYAKPPVGNLRFKSPQHVEEIPDKIIDCSKFGDVCLHHNSYLSKYIGSEDCLFLNVYTPKIGHDKLLPVMIFIHGGGFMHGFSDKYHPSYLLEEDVILVTINYRLGPLGFAYLPSAGIQGNLGLKDQQMALKWVNKYISCFNGDPKNVTVFGESAGGASVHLQVLSEESRKYFQKAICQSGLVNMGWIFNKDAEYGTRKLAEIVGSTGSSDKEAYEALMKASPMDLVTNAYETMGEDEKTRAFELQIPFKPVIEKNGMITKASLEALKTPNYFNMPLMIGCTSSEGIITVSDGMKNAEIYNKDPSLMVPRIFNFKDMKGAGEEIKKFFLDGPITEEKKGQMANLMSDFHFSLPAYLYAKEHAQYQQNSPLYYYKFSYDGDLNMMKVFCNGSDLPGACHADELFYIFKITYPGFEFPPMSQNCEMVMKTMCKLWTNFAKSGNPNDDSLPFEWKPLKKIGKNEDFKLNYLNIDVETKEENNPNKETIDFWMKIMEKYDSEVLQHKL